MSDETSGNPGGQNAPAGPQVGLQKIYVRDASVEVPDAPAVFTREFKPQMEVQINTEVGQVGDDNHQVTLVVTVAAKLDDKVAYLVEVQQAGVFHITGVGSAEERRAVLGAFCPSVVFPYARETVSELVQRAGFPQFLLQPVNFDALYREYMREAQSPASGAAH